MIEENIMYQQLLYRKSVGRKFCRVNVLRANLRKFEQKILCTPKKLPALTHMCFMSYLIGAEFFFRRKTYKLIF